jgi:hypothetical protein
VIAAELAHVPLVTDKVEPTFAVPERIGAVSNVGGSGETIAVVAFDWAVVDPQIVVAVTAERIRLPASPAAST